MSASNSGGGKANGKAADQARAAYMQKHPGQFPDSVSKGGHRGCGIQDRERAKLVPNGENPRWEWAMLGGMLAFKAGITNVNPMDLVKG